MANVDLSKYITLEQFLDSVHRYTEWINIRIINDCLKEKISIPEYLSRDVFQSKEDDRYGSEEYERLVKRYGNAHVWNIHAVFEWVPSLNNSAGHKGSYGTPAIEANLYFSEIKDAFLLEKEEKRKERQREARKRRREQ